MLNSLKKAYKKTTATLFLASVTASNAFAALPTMDKVDGRGNNKDGILGQVQGWGYQAVILAGLAISAVGFIVVASSLISGYKEVQDGKKKWGDLGMSALVGALILVVMIWLLTQSKDIL